MVAAPKMALTYTYQTVAFCFVFPAPRTYSGYDGKSADRAHFQTTDGCSPVSAILYEIEAKKRTSRR